MARKKQGKALFEVLASGGKAEKSLGVPGWFGQAKPAAAAPSVEPPAEPPPPPLAAPRSAPPVASRPPPPPEPSPRERMVSVSGGRLRVSLNQVSAAVVLGALSLVVFGAYQWGRHSVPRPAEPAQGIQAPYDPATTQRVAAVRPPRVLPVPVRPGAGRPTRPPAGMVPDNAARTKGCSYLVIQGGIPTYPEALRIKTFLYEKGINATIHRMPYTGNYMVKDMRGFVNIRGAEVRKQMRAHVEVIERLGKAYRRAGGQYDFRQSRDAPPWMITER